MCVAIAIKYNEWKVLGACSKFWCVVILNTLWQHTARQGCKTSSNRLLNIRPPHSYTPWLPYIKPRPLHAKAKCVRDYMASGKIGQRYVFIRGRRGGGWIFGVGGRINGSTCMRVCVWQAVDGFHQSLNYSSTWQWHESLWLMLASSPRLLVWRHLPNRRAP